MPHQEPVTVRATLLEAHQPRVEDLLRAVRHGPRQSLFPFAQMPEVHFARLVVLPEVTDLDGHVIPASLVYMADVDGAVRTHLTAFAEVARAGVDELFGHCEGYPSAPTHAERVAWLADRLLPAAAYYVHNVGRTVRQVRDEALLHEEIGRLLDESDLHDDGTGARGVRRRVQRMVLRRPDLAWAARPPRGPGLGYRLGKLGENVRLGVPGLLLLPVLLPAVVVWMLVVRVLEATDEVDRTPPDPEHVREVESYEDFGAQNAFTAVGLVKPGRVRRVTMQVALRLLDYGCRQIFHRDNLAGIRSIHFARWLPIDDGRRAIFASSYDGSLESYMDDFIDRVAWGVNLVFSNGVGYPRTRWLLFGGARDELAYKRHLRRRQVPTVVFYSAYDRLPAPSIDTNTQIRRGLGRAMDEDEAERWLALL